MAKLRNVKMIICDMAGTIIQERGIVYQVLHKSIQRFDPKDRNPT
jgi:beta-phosphoglucomutase-like phosphatase (HAD superfamily)